MKDQGQTEFPYKFVRDTIKYLSYLKYIAWDSLNKGSK